jgi:hypothetical protein
MVKARPGQSTTQAFNITNSMPSEMRFDVEVQDVVVKDGKRAYQRAGELESGIAANAVAAPAAVLVPAGQAASVNVTLTVPPESKQRAVIVYLHGKLASTDGGSVGLGASLGALVTFNLSSDSVLEPGPISTTPQSATANLGLSEELHNSGSEPIWVQGVVVILDAAGKRVAKTSFEAGRFLPGERLSVAAVSPEVLKPGHYRAISTFEFEGKVISGAGEFTVAE